MTMIRTGEAMDGSGWLEIGERVRGGGLSLSIAVWSENHKTNGDDDDLCFQRSVSRSAVCVG